MKDYQISYHDNNGQVEIRVEFQSAEWKSLRLRDYLRGLKDGGKIEGFLWDNPNFKVWTFTPFLSQEPEKVGPLIDSFLSNMS